MDIKGIKVILAVFLSVSLAANNNVAFETTLEMEERLANMTVPELVAQAKDLKREASLLQEEKESSQSPEKLKEISTRMSSIGSELDMIQTILVALGAGALIASVSDDDDDDMTSMVPPVDTLAPVINPSTSG